MNPLIDQSIITPDGLAIPDNTTQEGWSDLHGRILQCKRAAGKWLSQSRKWATDRFGVDFVAETEVQLEMALGIEPPKDAPKLNPADKSSAIVTIEGISQQFALWHRKMDVEIGTWDRSKIEKALGLIEPIEAEARRLRGMLV